MKMKNALKPCIVFLLFIAMSVFASGQEEIKTFTVTYYDISGNTQDLDAHNDLGMYFLQTTGQQIRRYQPQITSLGSEGRYEVSYNESRMPSGEYILVVWCYDMSQLPEWDYPFTKIFKKMDVQPGGAGSIDCSGDTAGFPAQGSGIHRFNLNVYYDTVPPTQYEGYFYADWASESSGFGRDYGKILETDKSSNEITLNEGKHYIYLPYEDKIPEPIEFIVDGADKEILLPMQTESVKVTVQDEDGNPLNGAGVEFNLESNGNNFEYWWTDTNGVLELTNEFIPGDYVVKACCDLYSFWVDSCVRDNSFASASFSLAKGETTPGTPKEIPLDCQLKYPVDIRTQFENGAHVPARVALYQYTGDSKSLLNWVDTNTNGAASVELSPGDYYFEGTYQGITGESEERTTLNSPKTVTITFPDTNATIIPCVKNPMNRQPVDGAEVRATRIESGRRGWTAASGKTGADGCFPAEVYTGKYSVSVTCLYPDGASSSQSQTGIILDQEGQEKTVDFSCYGSEIRATIVDEYQESPRLKRSLELTPQQEINTYITIKFHGGARFSSSGGAEGTFNVTPGLYDFVASLYYTKYPETSECPYVDSITGLCNVHYHITYKGGNDQGIEAGPGQIIYVEIPFRTWLLEQDPAQNPFGDIRIRYPSPEVAASGFEPSLILLACLVLLGSLLLAFWQSKDIEPDNK